jgi:hypothetical protein
MRSGYVVEIPDEVRRTQERSAAEIDALREPNKPPKDGKEAPSPKTIHCNVGRDWTQTIESNGCKFLKSW